MKKKQRKNKKLMKKNDAFRLLNFKNLKMEINGYGYHYSIRSFMLQLIISFVIILIAGLICNLDWIPIMCLMIVGALVTPYIILAQFQFLYEENRFSNAVNYMTQMIYSFKKTPKIINALQDTLTISDAKLAALVQYAIDYIEEGVYEEDLYKEALEPLEKEYGSDRMTTLHNYFMHVEKVGGEYRNGLNLVLNDIQGWTERTYCYQKDRKNLKFKAIISIVLCLAICAVFVNLLPEQFSISGFAIYQIMTAVLLSIFIFLYAIIQSKLNGSWLTKTKYLSDKQVEYNKITSTGMNLKSDYGRVIPALIVSLFGVFLFLSQKKYPFVFLCVGLSGFLAYFPLFKIKQAKKTIKKEIEKCFPDWIRELSLNLQMQNVYVAIKETTPTTPYILRIELEHLLKRINEDPLSIKPFNDFMKGYDVSELTANMSMIYSLNKYGKADAEKQINSLIERNDKLLEKSEMLKNKDEIGVTGFVLAVIPEIFTVIKLLVDMILMLITFMAMTQAVM